MRESLVRLLELKLDQNLLKPLNMVKTNINSDEVDAHSEGGEESGEEFASAK